MPNFSYATLRAIIVLAFVVSTIQESAASQPESYLASNQNSSPPTKAADEQQTNRWTRVINFTTQTTPALSGNTVGGVTITDDGRAILTILGTDQINILSADKNTTTILDVPHRDGGLGHFVVYKNNKIFFVNGQYVFVYDEASQTFRQITDRRNDFFGIAVNDLWLALPTVDPCGYGYALDIYNYSNNINDIAFQRGFARERCYPPGQTVINIDQYYIAATGDTYAGWWSKANLVGNEVFATRGRYDNYWSSNGGLYQINAQSGDVVTRTQSNITGLLSESPVDSLYDPYSATIYFAKGNPSTIYRIDPSSWTAIVFAYENSYLWLATAQELLTSLRIIEGSRITRQKLRIFDKSTQAFTEYSQTSTPAIISNYINGVAYRSDTDEIYIATNSGLSVLTSTSGACTIPFFSQVDDNWKNHPLRTTPNGCSAYCSTIGHCGCTLTSAAMVFNTYGASTNPPQLSDCMNTSACPYAWATGATCSQGKAKWVSRPGFSWATLDQQLNQNHRPILLGMCKKGTCQYDNDNDPETYSQTHWVVVLNGQGSDPANYRIHDPAFKCGANIPLSTRSGDWEFSWIGIYEGNIPCSSLIALTPPCVSRGANPQPVQFNSDQSANDAMPSPTISSSSVVSGTVWIYTRTELTMTVEITAASSIGNITDMLIWSDTMSNTTWQSFTPFVWLPVSDMVYASFRDNLGNVTDVYSDTINPLGPPNAPLQVFLPLIRR